MSFTKTTELDSNYHNLENASITGLLLNINSEDKLVPLAVEKSLPQNVSFSYDNQAILF